MRSIYLWEFFFRLKMAPTPTRNSKNTNSPLQTGPRTTAAFKTITNRGRGYINNSRNIANRFNRKPGLASTISKNLLNPKVENSSILSNSQTIQNIITTSLTDTPLTENNKYQESNKPQTLVTPTVSTDVMTENPRLPILILVRQILQRYLTF